MRFEIRDMRHLIDFCKDFTKILTSVYISHLSFLISVILFTSCQKDLELKQDIGVIKQVIISNFYAGNKLQVSISKSKEPDDYNSIDFLFDCNVDLFEDGVFKETMPYVLKDTLSGLGYYTSSFNLKKNKTYKIISSHAQLGVAEATEYLPPKPTLINFALLQHADAAHPATNGKYIIAFEDSVNWNNYYFLSTSYRILKPTFNNAGDTVYKYDYIWNIPSYIPEIPNPLNYYRSFTTDAAFDGQLTSFTVDFPSQYNNVYKEILLIVELSNCGKNFYDWNTQQLSLETPFNEGQIERINIKSNIINGYGHFTANNSSYITITIK